jgi:hypothetical protein
MAKTVRSMRMQPFFCMHADALQQLAKTAAKEVDSRPRLGNSSAFSLIHSHISAPFQLLRFRSLPATF